MERLGDFWSGSSRGSTGAAFEALLSPIHGSAMGAPGYRGLARNACHLPFVAMAMNMKRGLVLMQET
jgi:hypothetical protein